MRSYKWPTIVQIVTLHRPNLYSTLLTSKELKSMPKAMHTPENRHYTMNRHYMQVSG